MQAGCQLNSEVNLLVMATVIDKYQLVYQVWPKQYSF
jgi:hypothetical protein